MKLYVAVTDNDWFDYVAERKPAKANFWHPNPRTFGAIAPGSLFLFKPHSPLSYIVGGGLFLRFAPMPLSIAWDAFGEKNGAAGAAPTSASNTPTAIATDAHKSRMNRALERVVEPRRRKAFPVSGRFAHGEGTVATRT